MKKKNVITLILTLTTLLLIQQNVTAQKNSESSSYSNAAGMRIEFGSDYGTFAGISFKHFFTESVAGEMQLLFGNNVVVLEPEIQYHGDIPNAEGLKWYGGFGAGFSFASGYTTEVLLRPIVGMDYKINQVPLNFSFDWRPAFLLTGRTHFTPARFGLALRYAF